LTGGRLESHSLEKCRFLHQLLHHWYILSRCSTPLPTKTPPALARLAEELMHFNRLEQSVLNRSTALLPAAIFSTRQTGSTG
jgi:hypothetical protein